MDLSKCQILDDEELEKQKVQATTAATPAFRFRREDPSVLRASQIFGTPHKVPGAFQAFKQDPYLKKFPFQTNKTPSQSSPKFGPALPKPKTPVGSPGLKVLSPLLSVQAHLHPDTLPSLELGAAADTFRPKTPEYTMPAPDACSNLTEKATQTEEEAAGSK